MRNSIYRQTGQTSNQKQAQNSIIYPVSTIRQFLNMRRITKDKGCLIIFLLYCLALVIMMGIGFFYGNYSDLGFFTNDAANVTLQQDCNSKYLNEELTICSLTCSSNITYLNRICITSSLSNFNLPLSQEVESLISMYDIKYTFNMITYVSAGLLAATVLLFVLIIYVPKILYLYIAALFFMLLGMAFYLLKNVEIRLKSNEIGQSSMFYSAQQSTRSISFVLLGLYLVIFPFVLFSPKKIKMGIFLIEKLKQFYKAMSSMILFSLLVIAVAWGSLIIEIFLIMHFYTAGTISETPEFSMFHTYEKMNLSHPASLTFHFIGIFWLFATLISWHKYFVSSALCLWYFQESQSIYPVKRGLKRSLNHVGSAAMDGIFTVLQWILLLLYSILKTNDDFEQQKEDDDDDTACFASCFKSFRLFFVSCYRSINRNSPSSAVLTNYGYFQSCQNSMDVLSINNHRFFNIGGTLTIFLTLFVCILWVIVIYFILYFEVMVKQFPPIISSLVLPVFCVFIIGLVIGSLFSNIYSSSLDTLLYCYLTEKKSLLDGAQLQRTEQQLKIKKDLDQCYFKTSQEFKSTIFIYQETDENTMEITYISKKE